MRRRFLAFVCCFGMLASLLPCSVKANGRTTNVNLLETPEEEGIYLATLDLSMLRSYREDERPGAWRHPEKYEILTDTEIAYPFCP